MVGKVENFFALNKNKGASDSNSAHRPLRRSVHLHIATQLFISRKDRSEIVAQRFLLLGVRCEKQTTAKYQISLRPLLK